MVAGAARADLLSACGGAVAREHLLERHARDVGEGRAEHFVRDQFWISASLCATQVWLAGLYFFFVAREGKRYRLLGWLYVIPFALFLIGKGRGYYLAPVYPMLFAAGGVQQIGSLRKAYGSRCSGVPLRMRHRDGAAERAARCRRSISLGSNI